MTGRISMTSLNIKSMIGIMKHNIDLMMERGEKIETLHEKISLLRVESFQINTKAISDLRNKKYANRVNIVVAALSLIILAITMVSIIIILNTN